MINIVAYHGTPNGKFDRFDTMPVFTTDNKEAATAYATGSHVRDVEDAHLVTVEITLKNPKYFTQVELEEVLGVCEIDGEIEWYNFDNLHYKLADQGFDGAVFVDVEDYTGCKDGKRTTAKYDQYIAFSNDCVKIIKHERL